MKIHIQRVLKDVIKQSEKLIKLKILLIKLNPNLNL